MLDNLVFGVPFVSGIIIGEIFVRVLREPAFKRVRYWLMGTIGGFIGMALGLVAPIIPQYRFFMIGLLSTFGGGIFLFVYFMAFSKRPNFYDRVNEIWLKRSQSSVPGTKGNVKIEVPLNNSSHSSPKITTH